MIFKTFLSFGKVFFFVIFHAWQLKQRNDNGETSILCFILYSYNERNTGDTQASSHLLLFTGGKLSVDIVLEICPSFLNINFFELISEALSFISPFSS